MKNYNSINIYEKCKVHLFKFASDERFAKDDISDIKFSLMKNYNSLNILLKV